MFSVVLEHQLLIDDFFSFVDFIARKFKVFNLKASLCNYEIYVDEFRREETYRERVDGLIHLVKNIHKFSSNILKLFLLLKNFVNLLRSCFYVVHDLLLFSPDEGSAMASENFMQSLQAPAKHYNIKQNLRVE